MQPMTPVRNVHGSVSATLSSAFARAIFLAVVSGLTTVLMTRQIEAGDGTPTSWEEALIAGGVVALSAIAARLGAEGGYDGLRQKEGSVGAADVQTHQPALVVAPPNSPAHEGSN